MYLYMLNENMGLRDIFHLAHLLLKINRSILSTCEAYPELYRIGVAFFLVSLVMFWLVLFKHKNKLANKSPYMPDHSCPKTVLRDKSDYLPCPRSN